MLQFVEVENFSSQSPYVNVVHSGFDLVFDNIDIKDHPEFLKFSLKPYSALTSTLKTGPGVALHPINQFAMTLPTSIQKRIVEMLVECHVAIINGPEYDDEQVESYSDFLAQLEKLEDTLGDIILKMEKDTDLSVLLEEYVRSEDSQIPIADMADAGTRPHDSPEMTFLKEEAVILTTVSLYMKLLSLVMGTFLAKYSSVIDSEQREFHARAITNALLGAKYRQIMLKLYDYIERLIETRCKLTKTITPTSAYCGQSTASLSRREFDVAIVKRLVGADLYRSEGNIIKYLAASGKSGAESKLKNAENTHGTKIMSDPNDKDQSDEGNASAFEMGSRQSSKTADTPLIVECGAESLIVEQLETEHISNEEFEMVLAYYERNPLRINPFGKYLLGLSFGHTLGGGTYIQLLNLPIITKLTTILQITYARAGISQLAHIMSANMGTPGTRVPKDTDIILNSGWQNLPEYIECRKTLVSGFGEYEWNSVFRSFVECCLTTPIYYNTAPAIWDLLNERPTNGQEIKEFLPLLAKVIKFSTHTYLNSEV
jgi:hypothetical protein